MTSKEAAELDGKTVKTVGGIELPVIVKGKRVMIGKVSTIKLNIQAKNGVIHVVDSVIMPD